MEMFYIYLLLERPMRPIPIVGPPLNSPLRLFSLQFQIMEM